jgi:serine/threonine protein kinase
MWSLGEIPFRLITKQPVFNNDAGFAAYANQGQTFPFAELLAYNISFVGQNFISSLMKPAPEKRLTAEQALKHQWMTRYLPSTIQHSPPPPNMTIISATDSMTEAFAAWDSISSSPQTAKTNTLLPNKNGAVIGMVWSDLVLVWSRPPRVGLV